MSLSFTFRSVFARRFSLSKSSLLSAESSYVHKGTEYEMTVKRALEDELKIPLNRIGGSGDKGIDLTGRLKLEPDTKESIVAVQCKLKHEKSKTIDAKTVRELIGTLSQLPGNPIGILTSNAPMTAPAQNLLANHNRYRLIFMQIDHRHQIDKPILNIYPNYLFRLQHSSIQPVKVRRFNGPMDYCTLKFNLKK